MRNWSSKRKSASYVRTSSASKISAALRWRRTLAKLIWWHRSPSIVLASEDVHTPPYDAASCSALRWSEARIQKPGRCRSSTTAKVCPFSRRPTRYRCVFLSAGLLSPGSRWKESTMKPVVRWLLMSYLASRRAKKRDRALGRPIPLPFAGCKTRPYCR